MMYACDGEARQCAGVKKGGPAGRLTSGYGWWRWLFLGGGLVGHVDFLPGDGAVLGHFDAHEVVAGLGVVGLAHRVEGEVFATAEGVLVPGVDVAAECVVDAPLVELVDEVVELFAGEGGGKLHKVGAEQVGVGKGEGIAHVEAFDDGVEEAFFDKLYLLGAEGAAG